MNLLLLDATLRLLLFAGTLMFTLAIAGFITLSGRHQLVASLPWLGMSLTAATLTIPALCFTLLGLTMRYPSWLAPLAFLSLCGLPLSLFTIGLYAFTRRSLPQTQAPIIASHTPALSAPHHNRPAAYFQEVCRNPGCRAPVEADKPRCTVCGWHHDRPFVVTAQQSEEAPTVILPRPSRMADAPASLLAYMVVRNGPQAGTNYQLGKQTTIGSDAGNEIVLEDAFVASEHASIRRKGSGYVFDDLSSANGSFLLTNGSRQRLDIPHSLKHGDSIAIGDTVLVFMKVN